VSRIVLPALVLLALSVAHTVDHIVGHPAHGVVGLGVGYFGYFIIGITLAFALLKSPYAGLVAMATGFTTTIGLLAIHIAPDWSVFSDPYSDLDLGFVSWAIVFATMLGGIWLGVVGLQEMRRVSAESGPPAGDGGGRTSAPATP
jgi:hypothetical protein